MDFVIDNYLWFIIGAIVLLMIIIGYFAEKTDFGKKPLKTKKEKKEVSNIEQPLEETEEIVEETNNDVVEPIETIDEGVFPEIAEEITESLNEDSIPNINVPEEDLNVPFGDQEIVPETGVESGIESIGEVPNVPEVPDNGMSDESEDDVWKF